MQDAHLSREILAAVRAPGRKLTITLDEVANALTFRLQDERTNDDGQPFATEGTFCVTTIEGAHVPDYGAAMVVQTTAKLLDEIIESSF